MSTARSKTSRTITAHGPHFAPLTGGAAETTGHDRTRISAGYQFKRSLDVIVSLGLLCLLSPLLMGLAMAVRLTSRGPVIYRQRRLGLHEQPFWMFKFRSMYVDADRRGPQFTADNDPRITPVGRILRKTSLDELPQLINVLAGAMSLIGPRPYVGFELDQCSPHQRALRASLRPGISGLAQVEGRSSLSQRKSAAFDLEYVQRCSLSFDLHLIVRTIVRVLGRSGTN
jgi:lipopolysaccharide/colanic/teichoic acid biosynthesis glycosyltransferase